MAFLSFGFRPFFLFAVLLAPMSVAIWIGVLGGGVEAVGYPAAYLHSHEMMFGYTSAVIAGFLLTAIPNWTGRSPIRGWPLAVLAAVWLAGRLALLFTPFGNGLIEAAIEAAFLPLLLCVALREIVAGGSRRNLIVMAPIALLATANGLFHYGVLFGDGPDLGFRLGLAGVLMLIGLIGGRIIPSFTRNWLKARGPGRLPAQPGRWDMAALGVLGAGLVVWSIWPTGSIVTAAILVAAALLNIFRLARWAGERTLSNPLLFVLHVAYAFLPAGLLLLALAAWTDDFRYYLAGLHALGVGAIGGMTLAVMSRASLGHTGQALHATPVLMFAFAALVAAAVLRVAAALTPDAPTVLYVSAGFWVAAFLLFLVSIGPALILPRRQSSESG